MAAKWSMQGDTRDFDDISEASGPVLSQHVDMGQGMTEEVCACVCRRQDAYTKDMTRM